MTTSYAHSTHQDAARDLQWSTECCAVNNPVRRWGEALSEWITEMEVTSPVGNGFHAHWRRYGLGPLDLNFLFASPQRVVRSPAIVSRTRNDDYDLVFIRRGTLDVSHSGQKFRVPEGSFVVLDNQKPHDLLFETDSYGLTAHFTDRWLRNWVPYPETLVGRAISGAASWGAPLAATLVTIADTGLSDITLPRSVIADQCGALLALLAGPASPASTRHNRDLLTVLRRQLQARFSERQLDPASVAESTGISKRHLHGLFASAGTTFGATLLDIRLRRAAEMLNDPRFGLHQIGEVAWDCGFADASHFARLFRRRYGMTPLNYRRTRG